MKTETQRNTMRGKSLMEMFRLTEKTGAHSFDDGSYVWCDRSIMPWKLLVAWYNSGGRDEAGYIENGLWFVFDGDKDDWKIDELTDSTKI